MKILRTLLLLGCASLCLGAASQEPYIRLLAPAEESFLSGGKALFIGKVEGFHDAKMVEFQDNGKTVGFAPIKRNVFIYQGEFGEGRHELTLTAPGVRRLAVKLFMGKQSGYAYHIDPIPSACVTCHPKAAGDEYKVGPAQEALCTAECHDKVSGGEFIHGPVAAGSCTPCHDPHGSRNGKFLVAAGKDLCMTCHSQSLSAKHVSERANENCVKCHDPHSSSKAFHLR